MKKTANFYLSVCSSVLILGTSTLSSPGFADPVQAGLFSSNDGVEYVALNYITGKPPYNRSAHKRLKRKEKLQSVELSALEIVSNEGAVSGQKTYKKIHKVGGHPFHKRSY